VRVIYRKIRYLILVGKPFGTRPYDKMGLSVEQTVWMGDEWNWLTILSNGGLNVYAMDSNVARERGSPKIFLTPCQVSLLSGQMS